MLIIHQGYPKCQVLVSVFPPDRYADIYQMFLIRGLFLLSEDKVYFIFAAIIVHYPLRKSRLFENGQNHVLLFRV